MGAMVAMRRSKIETAATRRCIVASASSALRTRGIEAVSLGAVMAEVGLTHGGFYRHFPSREALVAEALDDAVDTALDTLAAEANRHPGREFSALVRLYLSSSHRDEPSAGCPFAALGSDLARAPQATRTAATTGLQRFITTIAATLAEPLKPRAPAIASLLVGALTVARVTDDAAQSQAILAEALHAAEHLGQP